MNMSIHRQAWKARLGAPLALAGIFAITSIQPVAAITLFNDTLTGADLLALPASFPSTRSTTTFGTSIDFGTGSTTYEKLIELDLFGAGDSGGGIVFGSIGVDWHRLNSGDNDSLLGLSDGTNFVGIEWGDNSGGTFWRTTSGTASGSDLNPASATNLGGGLGYSAFADQTLTIDYTIGTGGDVTFDLVTNSFSASIGPIAGVSSLNALNGLSLVIAQHESDELLRVR